MTVMLSATFDTRREAEMTVERLVQQFDLDRTAIFIGTEGEENSAGEEQAGSDTKAGMPSPEDRSDAPLNGGIVVTAEVADEEFAERVRDAFAEFDAAGVVETDPART
jgi:hypothetical protein